MTVQDTIEAVHVRISALLLLILSSQPASALADDDNSSRANELSGRALELAKKKDFAGALQLYEEALELDPGPQRQCNVGAAYFQLDRWAQAHFFLGHCLSHTGTLSASLVEQMSKAFAYADRKLQRGDFAKVSFKSVPGGAFVHLPSLATSARFRSPRMVWLPIAQHSFDAAADGFENQVGTFDVTSRKPHQHIIEFQVARVETSREPDTQPDTPALSHGQPSASAGSKRTTVAHVADAPAPSHTRAWIAFALGTASVVAGGAFHFRATQTRSDLKDMPSGSERSALVEDLKSDRLIMAGLYGTAALAFGLGTFLWLGADERQGGVLASASIGSDQAAVNLTWTY